MAVKINAAKQQAVADIKTLLAESPDVIFADYRGLNVEQITGLRIKLRERRTTFHVVKNNYAKLAIRDLGLPEVGDMLIGPTALALVTTDAGPSAKVILDYARDTTVKLKGAIIDGRLFDFAQVQELSNLPGREQLIAMLMSTMNAPLQNLVYVINGVTQKLVRVLQAVADKKKAGGE